MTDLIGTSRFLVKTRDLTDESTARELQRRLVDWLDGSDPTPLVLGEGTHAFEYLPDPPRWRHICCVVDPKRVRDG